MLNPNNTVQIFNSELLMNVWISQTPKQDLNDYIFEKIRRATGKIDTDENYISTIVEFNINNLIFLKDLFNKLNLDEEMAKVKECKKDDTNIQLICNLLNELFKLIQLEEENEEASGADLDMSARVTAKSVPLKDIQNLRISDESNTYKPQTVNYFDMQIDIVSLAKTKLQNLKYGLTQIASEYKNLGINEIKEIIKHVNITFFPFIKMYYFFCNIDREEEMEKLNFVINKKLDVLPLSSCIAFTDDKEELAKKEREEEEIRKENERLLTTQKDEKILSSKKDIEEVIKKEEKEKTYLDILEELSLNEETKQVIISSIKQMHVEIDSKVSDRQKRLDDRLKDIEELIKGKKK